MRATLLRWCRRWRVDPAEALLAGYAVLAVTGLAVLWTWGSGRHTTFGFVENTLLRGALLGEIVCLVGARRAIARALGETPRSHLVLLAAIVVAGAVLRFATEGLPFHQYNWLECLSVRTDPEPEPGWYGNGFGMWMRIPMLFGMDFERAVFIGNRVGGTLTVVVVYALDRAIFGDARKALWSAALLAVVPIHVRFSASETMQIVAALFTAVALFGFAVHASTGSRRMLVAGALAAFYATLTRPESTLVFVAAPLLYADAARWRKLFSPSWFAVMLPTGVVTLALLRDAVRVKLAGGTGSFLGEPAAALRNGIAGSDSCGWPHGLLALLVALGIATAVRRHGPRRALAPLALLALLVRLDWGNPTARSQMLINQLPVLALFASAAPAAVHAWLRLVPGIRSMVDLAAIGAGLAVLAWTPGAIRRWPIGDQQQEYRFLRDHRDVLHLLGPGLPLVRAVTPHDGAFATFPSYRLKADTRVFSQQDLLEGRVPLPALWYRSLSCYRFGSTPRIEDLHGCDEIDRRFELEAVATTRLDGGMFSLDSRPTFEMPPPLVGFFRIKARR